MRHCRPYRSGERAGKFNLFSRCKHPRNGALQHRQGRALGLPLPDPSI